MKMRSPKVLFRYGKIKGKKFKNNVSTKMKGIDVKGIKDKVKSNVKITL